MGELAWTLCLSGSTIPSVKHEWNSANQPLPQSSHKQQQQVPQYARGKQCTQRLTTSQKPQHLMQTADIETPTRFINSARMMPITLPIQRI